MTAPCIYTSDEYHAHAYSISACAISTRCQKSAEGSALQCFSFILQGVKEVTLLGQNVNSYRDLSETTVPVSFSTDSQLSRGFSTIYKTKQGGRRFVDLLDKVSLVSFPKSNVPLIRTQLYNSKCAVLCVSRWIQK